MAIGVTLPWSGRVEGLGEGAPQMPIWDTTLDACAARAQAAAGLATAPWTPGSEAVIVAGGSAIQAGAVRAALAAGRAAGRDLAFDLGGRAGALLAEAAGGAPPGGLWYLVAGGQGSLEARVDGAQAAELDPEERLLDLRFPGQTVPMPISDRIFAPVRHWLTLKWANLLGLGPHLWGALLGRPAPLAGLRVLWGGLRALSVDPERVAAALSVRGRGARVHHSAVVEACALGPGARVEAGAVVRGCVLGEGAVVEALAVVEASVLGPGALVQRHGMFKFGVMGPATSVGGAMQLCVVGPGAVFKRGSYGMDLSLSGAVRVRFGERLVPAPLGMAGVCLGDGVLVGSGVWIAPGRAVPPGVVAVPDEVLMDPGCPGPGVYRVRGGRLEPV